MIDTTPVAGVITIRENPWLWGLLGASGLLTFFGAVTYSLNGVGFSGDQSASAVQAQLFGLELLQIGGTLFTGWLIACAVCWHIAWSARRR